jgi:rod shape-determining protein MreC
MDVDLDAFRERVLVDKGAQDGVFVGQAVLDAGSVFGQVARVGQLTAEVILISDATHAIPVQINRNGLRTIAAGTGDMGRLKLPYLPTSADVVVGDLLVTSGLGGGFPAGYPVGTVAEVKRDPAQSLADVDVKPAAALDRSRELMFVWLKPQASSPMPAIAPSRAPKVAGSATASSQAPNTAAPAAVPSQPPRTGAPSPAPSVGAAASAASQPPSGTTPPPAKNAPPAKAPPSTKTPPPAKTLPPAKTPPPAGANDE